MCARPCQHSMAEGARIQVARTAAIRKKAGPEHIDMHVRGGSSKPPSEDAQCKPNALSRSNTELRTAPRFPLK